MERISIYLTLLLVIAVPALSQNQIEDIDLEKLKSQLPEGIIPAGFNTSSLPKIEEITNVIKEKCIKVSGSDAAFEEATQAAGEFGTCVSGLIDQKVLEEEIEKARPTGDLDTVFNKYCRKRTIAIECMQNFTQTFEPCLTEKEIEHKVVVVKIFTNLLNFVCHKDGDQIALFIAEKGPECFTEKKDAIINCVNSTFGHYVPEKAPTSDNLPQLIIGQEECNDMTKLQHCIIKELETCEESTPANLVEAAFKFIRNETPCVNFTSPASPSASKHMNKNSGEMIQTSFILLGTAVMVLTARFFA